MQNFLRKYGTSATLDFDLYSTDGVNILTSAGFAQGCCIISSDEGTSALSTNVPNVRTNGFSIDFTSSELSCKRLHVKIKDTNSTETWLQTSFNVETYGTSASQHSDIASGLLHNVLDTVPLQELLIELLSIASGNIEKIGDNYSYKNRSGSNTLINLSAASNNRVRN